MGEKATGGSRGWAAAIGRTTVTESAVPTWNAARKTENG